MPFHHHKVPLNSSKPNLQTFTILITEVHIISRSVFGDVLLLLHKSIIFHLKVNSSGDCHFVSYFTLHINFKFTLFCFKVFHLNFIFFLSVYVYMCTYNTIHIHIYCNIKHTYIWNIAYICNITHMYVYCDIYIHIQCFVYIQYIQFYNITCVYVYRFIIYIYMAYMYEHSNIYLFYAYIYIAYFFQLLNVYFLNVSVNKGVLVYFWLSISYPLDKWLRVIFLSNMAFHFIKIPYIFHMEGTLISFLSPMW